MTLPALTGTPKQIAAAERVRAAALAELTAATPAAAVRALQAVAERPAFDRKTGRTPYLIAVEADGSMRFGKASEQPDMEEVEPMWTQGAVVLTAQAADWLRSETQAGAILDRLTRGRFTNSYLGASLQSAMDAATSV